MVKFYSLYYCLRCIAAHFGFLPPYIPSAVSAVGLPGVTVYYSDLFIQQPVAIQAQLAMPFARAAN